MANNKSQSFKQAPIWELQRRYFEERSIEAWTSGDVPHYITSNPRVAKAYANMLLAFFRDYQTQEKSAEPYYLLELGAGSGRFSYHLIKALQVWQDRGLLPPRQFVYVITDFVEDMVSFWESHPRLRPFFEQGILDCALFDAEKDTSLVLRKSGKQLASSGLEKPIIIIANYFFDSIPQELYYFNDGKAFEANVIVKGYDPESQASAKAQLKDFSLSYDYQETNDNPYAGLPAEEQLFDYYKKHLKNSHLLFPDTAMKCLERLRQLSDKGLLLITADKAEHRMESWMGRKAPYLAKHGSFSFTVNYHALKEHCHLSGGGSLFPTHEANSLMIGVLFYLKDSDHYKETINSYHQWVNDYGPDDYYTIKKHLDKGLYKRSCAEILACLRWSDYDARLLQGFVGPLGELVQDMSEDERYMILQTVLRVWDGYYPLGEKIDLAFEIGSLLMKMEFFSEALSFLDLSEQMYGPQVLTQFSMACCLDMVGEGGRSLEILNILATQEGYQPALDLLEETKKESPHH